MIGLILPLIAVTAPVAAYAQPAPEQVAFAPQPLAPATLKIPRGPKFDAAPSEAVEIRAKDEWLSNEGFRFTGSKVAFNRRF